MAVASACGPSLLEDPQAAREFARQDRNLVFLGVDGMDWAIAEPMMVRGELPELSRLLGEGARVPLESRRPMNSPALWTTMATGVTRDEHGVLDFVYLPRGGARQRPTDAGVRTRLAFWEILTFLERPSVTVGWFVSWPAVPVQGALITDRWGVGGEGEAEAEAGTRLTWPPALEMVRAEPQSLEGLGEEMRSLLRPGLPSARDPVLRPGGALDEALKYLETDLLRVRMAVALAASQRPAVTACYLQSPDAVSHFAWKYMAPDAGRYVAAPDAVAGQALGGAVEASYRLADRVLGALRAAAGSEAAVILVSDHGFAALVWPNSVLVHLDVVLEGMGLLKRTQGGGVDLEASAAFPGSGTGIVEPFGSRDRLIYHNQDAPGAPGRAELIRALRRLRTEAGTPFFDTVRVLKVAEAAGVDAPDLVVRVSRDVLRDERLVLPGGGSLVLSEELLYQYDDVSGTHRPEAVLVVAGPGIPAGAFLEETARPEDVFALILWLAGAPLPRDVRGRVPAGLLMGDAPSPAWVRSYEDWIERVPAGGPGAGGADDPMIERLRSLGYVD